MDIALDEVIYFDAVTHHPTTGAVTDADSTPTFEVFEEATDTDIGVGGNLTKRTSKTGNYRGSFTLSSANGFEAGKWYSIIGSATVNSIAGKGVLKNFRVVPAESSAGVPKVDPSHLRGTAISSNSATNWHTLYENDGSVSTLELANVATLYKLQRYVSLLARADAAVETNLSTELGEINMNYGGGAGDYEAVVESHEAHRTLLAAVSTRIPAALTAGGHMSSQLANSVTHGGAAALLQLGSSSSTPALLVASSGGDAVQFTSTGGNGDALQLAGHGTGSAIRATAGATGTSVLVVGGGTSGNGIDVTTTDGHAFSLNASGDGKSGLVIDAGTNADAVLITGAGIGGGVWIEGGANGYGINISGGATSGEGMVIQTISGDGVLIAAAGTSKHGVNIIGGSGGTSDGLKVTAGTGGVDVRANITGNITGTLATVTTLTNLPAITANWLTAAGMDATASAEIADAVWDEVASGHTTAGTFGKFLDQQLTTLLTTAMTESYAADGATITPAQALYMIVQRLIEFAISGTTVTVKRRDGSTTAFTNTVNDATNPTSITQS